MEYLDSAWHNMPIGLCDRTAPIANVLASVVKTNGSSKLGYMKTRVVKAKKKKNSGNIY